jgi:hypothetical protein
MHVKRAVASNLSPHLHAPEKLKTLRQDDDSHQRLALNALARRQS